LELVCGSDSMSCLRWKGRTRRLLRSLVNRCGGTPTPQQAITVSEWAKSAPATDGILLRSQAAWQLPAGRSVAGNLAAADTVAATIDSQVGRARYWQNLDGAVSRTFEAFVVSMASGQFGHCNGLVITPDNRVLSGGTGISFSCPHPTNPLRLTHLPRPRRIVGSVAVLACFAGENYYHWFVSNLARLRLYEATGTTPDVRFFVPVDKSFQRDSLRLLGIPDSRIVSARPQVYLQADRLLVSSVRDQQISPEDCHFLHERLTRHLATDLPVDQRLVIMRRRAGRRSVVNQQELLQSLKPLGFKPVWLERLPLAQQIELFYRAECVVGPHGAGLTNLLFCRPGALAIELGTPYRVLPCFAEIAHHRRLHHHLELATPVNLRHFDAVEGVGESDLLVDSSAIRSRVERLLAGRELRRGRAA
jgi:hypothetical protein